MLGPHTLTHFPHSSPHIPPPHTSTLPHSPHTLSHTLPHTFPLLTHLSLLIPTPQHTSLHLPPQSPYLLPQLPSPLPTPQHTSPLTPCTLPQTHIFPHSLDYVAKLPCDDVPLINLAGLWKNSIKFFTTTGNLKSCFGVGNVNFR